MKTGNLISIYKNVKYNHPYNSEGETDWEHICMGVLLRRSIGNRDGVDIVEVLDVSGKTRRFNLAAFMFSEERKSFKAEVISGTKKEQ